MIKPLKWLGLVIGLGLFAWALSSVDLKALWGELQRFRWRFGWVVLFYGVIFLLDTLGWRFALSQSAQRQVRWDRLFRARLAGEALNYVTPTASLGGEPMKAYLLMRRYGVPLAEGVSSVIIAKTTFTLSMLLFVTMGLLVALLTQSFAQALMKWVWVTLGTLSFLLGLFVVVQLARPFGWLKKFLQGLQGWVRVEEVDEQLLHFYRRRPKDLLSSLAFHFFGWMAGVIEVYLILTLLGISVTWSTAWSIEAVWVLLRSGAFLIPASLGASEGISLAVCVALGIGAVSGLGLALIRRGRELVWMGLGLAEFARPVKPWSVLGV